MQSRQDHDAKKSIAWGMALASLAWLLQPVANAQSDAETLEAVRACQRVPGLSSRLACYDSALPPIVNSVDGDVSPPPLEERAATVARPEPPLATTVQIVEVQMPSLNTTLFRAADGRVFVRENARTIHRWPDTPFDVQIESSILGSSTYLRFPNSGLRVRVVVRN